MVTVYSIQPASGGFGMYQRGVEGQRIEGIDDATEYVQHVLAENSLILAGVVEGDVAEDDTDESRLIAGIADRDGKTYDQSGGTIVGFICRDGAEAYELVYED